MTKTPSASRRRGGQPGNRNAVRHGFYARYLPELPALPPAPEIPDPAEKYIADIGVTVTGKRDPINRLDNEVAMLRLAVRNIAAQSANRLTLAEELELLRSISLAGAAINRLLRTQDILYQPTYTITKDPNFRYEDDDPQGEEQGEEQEEDQNGA